MKYPKILSITLANGLGFLIFGSILAGCQKTAISKKGFLTTLVKQTSRVPASTSKKFEDFQDPKQIYVYCQVNDMNAKRCYERHLKGALNRYIKKTKATKDQIANYEKKHSYDQVKGQAHKALAHVFMALGPKINTTVEKRVGFCEENSSLYMERCLNQYLKKETFEILNEYQSANAQINGHEYLFLKDQIKRKLQQKLASANQEIELRKKKAQSSHLETI